MKLLLKYCNLCENVNVIDWRTDHILWHNLGVFCLRWHATKR